MTLRDLSAKDVIQLKPGRTWAASTMWSLTSTTAGCNRSFCAGGRTAFVWLAATMTDPPVGEHPHHRHRRHHGRCRAAARRAPPLMSANRIFCVKFRKNRLYFWDTML